MKAPPTTKNKAAKKKYDGDGRTSDDEFLESLKEPNREYTVEELEQLQKRADLQREETKLNMVSEFIGANGDRQSLNNINLVTKEEFFDYSFRLHNRLELLSKSEFYPEFLDNLLNGLTKPISCDAAKRLSAKLQTILSDKQKEESDKRSSKSSVKKTVKQQVVERRTDYDSFGGEGINALDINEKYDEDNDFM